MKTTSFTMNSQAPTSDLFALFGTEKMMDPEIKAVITETLPKEEASNMDAPFLFRVIYICLGCLGILGNLMVLVVMMKFKNLRLSMTNKCICNQSVLDLSASFFITLSSVLREALILPAGILQELFCRLWLTN